VVRARLFSVVVRGSGHTLKHRRSPLNIQKRFVTVRVAEPWLRLPREVVESPSLEILKSCLDMVLGNAALSRGGWTRGLPEVSSNLCCSVILR